MEKEVEERLRNKGGKVCLLCDQEASQLLVGLGFHFEPNLGRQVACADPLSSVRIIGRSIRIKEIGRCTWKYKEITNTVHADWVSYTEFCEGAD